MTHITTQAAMFPGCLRVAVVVLLVVTHGVQLGHARLGPGSRHDALAGFRDHTSVTRSLRGRPKPMDFDWNPVVVVLAHSRESYLREALCSLLRLEDVSDFAVAVSIDNPTFKRKAEGVIARCQRSSSSAVEVALWEHHAERRPSGFHRMALYKIARHFRMAMNRGFVEEGYSHMILLEEDLVVAPDFLSLFTETAWLLHADHSLWCVSAWNDNGFKGVVSNENRLFRTDYFPGLGWMLRSQLWLEELQEKWPEAASTGWDHWMRVSSTHKGRECIVPEVSRTKHIGDKGANVNPQTAAMYHNMAVAHRQPKPRGELTFGDLFYLMEDDYTRLMGSVVRSATRANSLFEVDSNIRRGITGVQLLTYERKQWKELAVRVGLPRSSPRATHAGLTAILHKEYPLLLADRRMCPYLEDSERLFPNPDVRYIAAKRGDSCTNACATIDRRCVANQLQWANKCEVLAKLFPCEAGCGHQVGAEIPAYVVERSQLTFQQCLTSDELSESCNAAHSATRRVCPCA